MDLSRDPKTATCQEAVFSLAQNQVRPDGGGVSPHFQPHPYSGAILTLFLSQLLSLAQTRALASFHKYQLPPQTAKGKPQRARHRLQFLAEVL